MRGMLGYPMTRNWVSVLSLLIAGGGAVIAFLIIRAPLSRFSCLGHLDVRQGANVAHATQLVGFSGLVAALVVFSTARWPRLCAAVLILEAVVLGVALILLAADSATYVVHVPYYACDNSNAYTDVDHFGALYAVWGVPAALLLLRAIGAWKGMKPSERRQVELIAAGRRR